MSDDRMLTIGVFIFLTSFIVGMGVLFNKGMEYDMIEVHLSHGANFPQAYCAVHEPRTILKCVDKILSHR